MNGTIIRMSSTTLDDSQIYFKAEKSSLCTSDYQLAYMSDDQVDQRRLRHTCTIDFLTVLDNIQHLLGR